MKVDRMKKDGLFVVREKWETRHKNVRIRDRKFSKLAFLNIKVKYNKE